MNKINMIRERIFAALIVAISAIMPSFAITSPVTKDYKLTGDETFEGTLTINEGVKVDLAGHNLTVGGLAGAGTIMSSVAAEYQRLEYLESSGQQYINTGYKPVSATTAEMRIRFTGNLPVNNGSWKTVFGSRNTGSTTSYFGVFLYKHNGNVYFWRSFSSFKNVGDSVVSNLGVVQTGVDYYLQLDKDGKNRINSAFFGDGQKGDCSHPSLLFAMNQNGDSSPWIDNTDASAAGMRYYYCRFAENGNIVHDFVPAKRLSDNALGMYDLTTGEFKTNSGSGTFTAGAERSERAFAKGELHLALGATSAYDCSNIKIASNVAVVADAGTLASDVDLRALGTVFFTAGESVDLGGKSLKVSSLGGNGTVTGTSSVGELHIDVPTGVEFENRDTTFAGTMKLVKDGDGTFIASKPSQLYTGGTLVADGEFRLMSANRDTDPYIIYYGEYESNVEIASGAVMNFDGHGNQDKMNFILSGGEIKSDKDRGMKGCAWISSLKLTADSKISGYNFGFVNYGANPMTVDLGGKTLTLDVTPARDFYTANTTFIGGGRLIANTGGFIGLGNHNKPCTFADGVTLDVRGTGLDVIQPVTMAGTYESNCNQQWDKGNGIFNVSGCFKPCATLYHNTLLKNGATLDLSQMTTTLENPCTFTGSKNTSSLSFETDAEITIALGSRTPAVGDILVAWDAIPEGCTFKYDEDSTAVDVPLVIAAAGLCYGADPNSKEVNEAHWTGAAGDGDLTNPANWECKNAAGQVVAEAVPGALSALHFTGDVSLQIPSAVGFTWHRIVFQNAKLMADCDWRGLGDSFVFDGTLDLNGHKLMVSSLGGTGTIIDTSKGYVQLEYLQSQEGGDGNAGQYIDTGICHTTDTKADIKVQFGALPAKKNWLCYFGARSGNSKADSFCAWIHGNNDGNTYHWRGVSSSEADVSSVGAVNTSSIYNVHLEKTGPCTIDGKAFATGSGTGYTKSMLLFACRNGNGFWGAGKAKIYACTIWEGDTKVRDFIPVKRISDGAFGMYDKVEDKFYGNAGTGEFLGGVEMYNNEFVSEGGLVLDVAEGKSIAIDTVSLADGVKLVKMGKGALVANKPQTFLGGAEFVEGVVTLGNKLALGERNQIEICANAVFELNGIQDMNKCTFVLNGGKMQNTKSDIGVGVAQLSKMKLKENSTLNIAYTFGFVNNGYSECLIDLGGKTLYVSKGGGKSLWLTNTKIENGIMHVSKSGWFVVGGVDRYGKTIKGVDARTAKLYMYSAMHLYSQLDVGDYESVYDENWNKGTAAMNVYGTFTPHTQYFYGCTLQDGATLDLTAQTDTWSTTSAFTEGSKVVTFADNATIYVKPGAKCNKIVSWETKPTNYDTLTFKLSPAVSKRGQILKREDGLYYQCGLTIVVR